MSTSPNGSPAIMPGEVDGPELSELALGQQPAAQQGDGLHDGGTGDMSVFPDAAGLGGAAFHVGPGDYPGFPPAARDATPGPAAPVACCRWKTYGNSKKSALLIAPLAFQHMHFVDSGRKVRKSGFLDSIWEENHQSKCKNEKMLQQFCTLWLSDLNLKLKNT